MIVTRFAACGPEETKTEANFHTGFVAVSVKQLTGGFYAVSIRTLSFLCPLSSPQRLNTGFSFETPSSCCYWAPGCCCLRSSHRVQWESRVFIVISPSVQVWIMINSWSERSFKGHSLLRFHHRPSCGPASHSKQCPSLEKRTLPEHFCLELIRLLEDTLGFYLRFPASSSAASM